MRPCTDDELRALLEKLMKFIGRNAELLLKNVRGRDAREIALRSARPPPPPSARSPRSRIVFASTRIGSTTRPSRSCACRRTWRAGVRRGVRRGRTAGPRGPKAGARSTAARLPFAVQAPGPARARGACPRPRLPPAPPSRATDPSPSPSRSLAEPASPPQTCFAKITHSGKIHLQITCLDHLAQHALHKVWLKPSAEMAFLYGNNVSKAGLGRITDAAPQYAGVVVLNLQETPLGFGVLAQPTEACKDLDPTANVVLHQADVGEYLRLEETLF